MTRKKILLTGTFGEVGIETLKELVRRKNNYDISVLVLFGPSNELSETILFIEGDDSNDEELNNRRDRVIRDIRSKNQEILLIVLDTSILI